MLRKHELQSIQSIHWPFKGKDLIEWLRASPELARYGDRQQESQFFVPKVPEQAEEQRNRIEELRETNSWFLDTVYFYSDRIYQPGAPKG